MKKTLFLTLFFIVFTAIDIYAQCAMCRATVGSTLSDGRNTIATGLNTGILYLLFIPYIIVALGIFFYRKAAKQTLKEKGLI